MLQDRGELEEHVRKMLELIGEDPGRPGLLDTPRRVVDSWLELFSGYDIDPTDHVTTFAEEEVYDDIIVLRDIRFFSSCEHHILPFYGVCHIAYLPQGNSLLGVSKLARIMEVYTRRLQVQERMTRQIAEAVLAAVDPVGVGVVVQASHMCMVMRGVQKPGSTMVTSSMLGSFKDTAHIKAEVLQLMGL